MSEPIPYWEEIKRKLIHLSSLWMVCSTILLPRLFPAYGRWINCGLLLFCLVSCPLHLNSHIKCKLKYIA